MSSNFVENPELGRLYLVKRNKSGDPSKRFQPATIHDRAEHTISVRWLFDGSYQQDVLMFYGAVKMLTRKWLTDEAKRKDAELEALENTIVHINTLRFDPLNTAQITS